MVSGGICFFLPPEVLGTKPKRSDFHRGAAGAFIPKASVSATVTCARYINVHTLCIFIPHTCHNTKCFYLFLNKKNELHQLSLCLPLYLHSAPPDNNDLKRILNELAALQSPNSIARAANVSITIVEFPIIIVLSSFALTDWRLLCNRQNLAKMCNSGRKLEAAGCVKSSSQLNWKM